MLGSTLFLIYINDLPEALRPHNTTMFADDTSITIEAKSIANLHIAAQDCIVKAETWFANNELALHPKKTKCILSGSNLVKSGQGEKLQVSNRENMSAERLLGVELQPDLHWKGHIESVIRKVTGSIACLFR